MSHHVTHGGKKNKKPTKPRKVITTRIIQPTRNKKETYISNATQRDNAGIPSISFSLLMLWCERVSLTCHFNLSLAPPRHWLLMHAVRKMSSQILRISGGSRYTCLSFHSSPFFVIVWSSGFFRVKNNHVIAHCCVSAPKKVHFFFHPSRSCCCVAFVDTSAKS